MLSAGVASGRDYITRLTRTAALLTVHLKDACVGRELTKNCKAWEHVLRYLWTSKKPQTQIIPHKDTHKSIVSLPLSLTHIHLKRNSNKEEKRDDRFKNIDFSLLHNRCWRLRSVRACLLHRTLMSHRHVNYSTGTNRLSSCTLIGKHTDWITRHSGNAISIPSVQQAKVNGTTYRFHACMGSAGELIRTCVHT